MFFSTKFVIFPEVTEVTKVTGVGGIVELGSAKGDCRLREFARFSFVLSVAEQKSSQEAEDFGRVLGVKN